MMPTDIAKLEKFQLKHLSRERDKDRLLEFTREGTHLIKTVLIHPVFSIIGGFAAIEYLQLHPERQPIFSPLVGTALEGLLGGAALMDALGKSGALDAITGLVGGAAGAAAGAVVGAIK